MTTISFDNGKVLDVAILSKSCRSCTSMKKIASSDPARCKTWKLSHIVILIIPANLAAMKSACMAAMYHFCGYHDNGLFMD